MSYQLQIPSCQPSPPGRDLELVGHLGLVRYLRTGQIADMMFPGRAQSVVSERLGELAKAHGSSKPLLKRLWYVNREGRRVQVWTLTGTGYGVCRGEARSAAKGSAPRCRVAVSRARDRRERALRCPHEKEV